MSQAGERPAEIIPQAPSALHQRSDHFKSSLAADRKASGARSLQSSSSSAVSFSLTAKTSKGRLDGHASGNTKAAPHEDDEPQRVSPGDLLNTVGSASSLSSAASSVFSSNQANMSYHNGFASSSHALTPLTNAESSPPGKLPSPRTAKRTFEQMHHASISTSPYHAPAGDAHGTPQTITPVQTPPEPSLQARPGPGEAKGCKLTYDPETDPQLTSKDRRKFKPKYKTFGAEVRSTIMLTMISLG